LPATRHNSRAGAKSRPPSRAINSVLPTSPLDADVELLTKPFTVEALAGKIRQILSA
jgi:hypothetical protein